MILHIKSHMTNFKHSVPATYEGIKSLFSMFPFVEEIIAHHHNFQEALNEIVDYLSSHHMEAWVSQEPQKNNKGLNELLKIIDESAKEEGLEWYKPQSAEPIKKSEDFSRVSSVIVATDDKMLMLQRRDNNKWTFPSGHLNDTETHLEGAVRELWEEAGIRANPDEMILLGNKKTFQNKDIHVYLYKVNSEIKPSADNDPDKEAKKFEWLPHVLPEEIKSNIYIPVGENASLSMFSMWLLRQKTNKLKKLVEFKKKN